LLNKFLKKINLKSEIKMVSYKRSSLKWKPSPKNSKILDIAMKHIKSVPYKVSVRWLFYRLLQDGIYKKKTDYHNKYGDLISRARHTFYNGWRPDTLADESRNMIWRGIGSFNENQAIDNIRCNLDKFLNQDYFVMLLYEANAMTGQFEEYTSYIPLVPFGGDPSIPYKWDTAMAVNNAYKLYGLPVVLLYFGDCDDKGEQIQETAINDVRKWCPVDFEVIRCGLTLKQALKYKLPKNPDRPNEYQWEALTDVQARENKEKEIVEKWKQKLKEKY
jgi:hypothetical protein